MWRIKKLTFLFFVGSASFLRSMDDQDKVLSEKFGSLSKEDILKNSEHYKKLLDIFKKNDSQVFDKEKKGQNILKILSHGEKCRSKMGVGVLAVRLVFNYDFLRLCVECGILKFKRQLLKRSPVMDEYIAGNMGLDFIEYFTGKGLKWSNSDKKFTNLIHSPLIQPPHLDNKEYMLKLFQILFKDSPASYAEKLRESLIKFKNNKISYPLFSLVDRLNVLVMDQKKKSKIKDNISEYLVVLKTPTLIKSLINYYENKSQLDNQLKFQEHCDAALIYL